MKNEKEDRSNYDIENYNRYQFCEMVSDFFEYLLWENPNDIFWWVENYEKLNQLAMAPSLNSLGLSAQERTLFYLICHDFESKDDHRTALSERLKDVYFKMMKRWQAQINIRTGKHPLQVQGLVKVSKDQGTIYATLTEKGQRLFLEEDYEKRRSMEPR